MALRNHASSTIDETKAHISQQKYAHSIRMALAQGNLLAVRTMLAQADANFNIDITDEDEIDVTILIRAISTNHPDIVDLLINVYGANVNTLDSSDQTPLFHATYLQRTDIVRRLLAAPDIRLNQVNKYGRCALHFSTAFLFNRVLDKEIYNLLIDAHLNWLLHVNRYDIPAEVLDALKEHKDDLFSAILKLPSAKQLDVLKQIIEGKDTTALGIVFWYKKSAHSIQKGTMALVYAKYLELTKTEQRNHLTDAELEVMPLVFLVTTKQINEHKLLQILIKMPVALLTPTHLEKLKACKTELLNAINALPDDQPLSMLEQIFDETKSDMKNDSTALGKVFWAGHPNLSEGRLGAAYKRYCELKSPNATFEKPLQPSKASQLFGNLFGKGKEPELKVLLDAEKTASSSSSAFLKFNDL